MLENEVPFHSKGHDFRRAPAIYCRSDFPKDPWMAHRGPTDHQTGDICFPETLKGNGGRIDIPITNHWNIHSIGNSSDDAPIGFACVALLFRASMNRETGNALAFENASRLEGIDRARIPPDADFGGDRQTSRRRHNLPGHARQERTVLE